MNETNGVMPPLPSPNYCDTLQNATYCAPQPYFEMPPISQMLYKEANAWTALLSLHGGVLNSISVDDSETSLHRESAYISQLSQLLANVDALGHEIVKLRSLRKSRLAISMEIEHVLRGHTDEYLTSAEILSKNSALSIASATTALRLEIQQIKSQITQLRALLEAIHERHKESLSSSSQIVVGIIEDGVVNYQPIEEVLSRIYRQGDGIDEDSVRRALSQLDVDDDDVKSDSDKKVRFTRRTKDGDSR